MGASDLDNVVPDTKIPDVSVNIDEGLVGTLSCENSVQSESNAPILDATVGLIVAKQELHAAPPVA